MAIHSSDQLLNSVIALGRKFRFEEQHARHVAFLAVQLFDQLQPLHGLGAPERRLLEAAAWLHDIGQYIAYRGHHKHSHYLITHAELPGCNERERALIAAVARYHRKSAPRLAHAEFARLDKPGRACVRALAALLRIADAFDRCHAGTVRSISADIARSHVCLTLDAAGPLAADASILARKTQLFRDVFNYDIIISGNGRHLKDVP